MDRIDINFFPNIEYNQSAFYFSSTDESATEAVLKSMKMFGELCGELEMTTPRDAFITALCKASLPPHYTLTILNSTAATQNTGLQSKGGDKYCLLHLCVWLKRAGQGWPFSGCIYPPLDEEPHIKIWKISNFKAKIFGYFFIL